MVAINYDVIGFDLDGTLCDNWGCETSWWYNIAGKIGLLLFLHLHNTWITRKYLNWYVSKKRLRLYPIINSGYVITGRPNWLQKSTRKWLLSHRFIPLRLVNCPFTSARDMRKEFERALYKAKMINKKGITIFYEDELGIRQILKNACPKTRILEPNESIEKGHAIPY